MIEFRDTSRESRVPNVDAMHRRSATRLLPTRHSHLATRRGVTLIELLITITIVSILSAAFLGTSQLAMESSRKSRTKATVGKLHGLLMEKWGEYSTRRVDIHPAIVQAVEANILSGGTWTPSKRRVRGLALADLRLLATRELMKLEMPDRWTDITLNAIPASNPINRNIFRPQSVLAALPAITNTYRREYLSLADGAPDQAIVLENQSAECLYMIIMHTTADGEARTLFSEQDIGDTDNDGAPEFLDGWGRPIDFIRWPAGFWQRSDLMEGPSIPNVETGESPKIDHDPTDVFHRDEVGIVFPDMGYYRTSFSPSSVSPPLGAPTLRTLMGDIRERNLREVLEVALADGSTTQVPVGAFRLVPLVFSRGPDGVGDIDADIAGAPAARTSLDPYAIDISRPQFEIGLPFDTNNDGDDNSLDNIHNHLQDNR